MYNYIVRSSLSLVKKISSDAFIGSKNNGPFILSIYSGKKNLQHTYNRYVTVRYCNSKANYNATGKLSKENTANMNIQQEAREKLKTDNSMDEVCDKLMKENIEVEEAMKKSMKEDGENNEGDSDSTNCSTLQDQLNAYIESDPDNAKRYKVLQLEIEILQQNGEKVPTEMQPHHWTALFSLKSRRQRQKYLSFLWVNEIRRKSNREKKQKKLEEHMLSQPSPSEDPNQIQYGLGKNTMFLRIYDTNMNYVNHARLMNAMLYGQKLVFDCGYDEYMTLREQSSCVKQLLFAFSSNRVHIDPFDLYFCNLNESSEFMENLERAIPTIKEPDFPINLTSKSYLEIFDKNSLVYLTPHCNNELQEYDVNAVYIIGALVDKTHPAPLSLAKAKREGLKMAKLPLSKHLKWGAGSGKNLNVNHVFDILLATKTTGNWGEAVKQFVPTRKLASYHEHMLERRLAKSISQSKKSLDNDFNQQEMREKDDKNMSYYSKLKFRAK